MMLRKDRLSETYIETLAEKTYTGLSTSKEELYQIAFGNVVDSRALYRRPFSKITRDLAFELGLMKYLVDIYGLDEPNYDGYEWIYSFPGTPIAVQNSLHTRIIDRIKAYWNRFLQRLVWR
jgi:hypothetical protein